MLRKLLPLSLAVSLLLSACSSIAGTPSPVAVTHAARATASMAATAEPTRALPTAPPVDVTAPAVTLVVDPPLVPWLGQSAVQATATDDVGVTELRVLLGDQLLARAETGALAFDLIPGALAEMEPGGAYTLEAAASDAAGNEGRATQAITVGQPDTPTPTVAPLPTASPTPAAQPEPSAVPPTPTRPVQSESRPVEPTRYRVTEITLPTYPYQGFVADAVDPELGDYPLRVLDRAAYEASNPRPAPKKYTLLVLENRYLRLGILPELGGRIYECTFKPTGHNEFYSNPVIKPTGWGPPSPPHPQGASWWLAAGGLEWGFPVEEHGYEWSRKWGFDHVTQPNGGVMLTVFTSGGPAAPYAVVDIILPPDTAYFVVQPRIVNPRGGPFRFKWWSNAMLAPGAPNQAGAETRFIVPTAEMRVHSTGDPFMPGPGQEVSWPVYNGRDLSRLGNWGQYLGLFQSPAAQGNFIGVYDTQADEGMLRIYPSDVARGTKIFAPGWNAPLDAAGWTDDDSRYVELHGGLTPTFDDWYELPPGGEVTWSEIWYPVAGIGGVTWANADGAVTLSPSGNRLRVGLFPTVAVAGRLVLSLPGGEPIALDAALSPAQPFFQEIELPASVPPRGEIAVTLEEAGGAAFEWRGEAVLR